LFVVCCCDERERERRRRREADRDVVVCCDERERKREMRADDLAAEDALGAYILLGQKANSRMKEAGSFEWEVKMASVGTLVWR